MLQGGGGLRRSLEQRLQNVVERAAVLGRIGGRGPGRLGPAVILPRRGVVATEKAVEGPEVRLLVGEQARKDSRQILAVFVVWIYDRREVGVMDRVFLE